MTDKSARIPRMVICASALIAMATISGCGGGRGGVSSIVFSAAAPAVGAKAELSAGAALADGNMNDEQVCTTARSAPGSKTAAVGLEEGAPGPSRSVNAAMEHSDHGPIVDQSKLAYVSTASRYTNDRVKKLWIDPGTNLPGPNSQVAHQNLNDIGAFRENTAFAGMNYDDAIVFPGQPGKSHLHTYFGALSNATTTTQTIRNLPWTTAAGGTLNKSSYWVPAMIDTRDSTPQVPTSNNVYYKCAYEFSPASAGCKNIVPVPVGLRFISGSASNKDPAVGAINVRYLCMGPNGENPGWKNTITAAYADGTCVGGGDFMMEVIFPICWDGVNLDSPDHKSHVVNPAQLQQPPWTRSCPADHPKQLPSISYNIHYPIPDAQAVSRWRLSSDMYDPSLPAGLSGHGDYMMGWDPAPRPDLWPGENSKPAETIVERWTNHCLHEQRDCHNFLLGDNINTLY